MGRRWARIAGPIVGVCLFLLIFSSVGGMAGLTLGICAFIGLSAAGERFWRRGASAAELRQDLADRVRNPPS